MLFLSQFTVYLMHLVPRVGIQSLAAYIRLQGLFKPDLEEAGGHLA